MRLRRSDVSGPGFRRVRHGNGFTYYDADGKNLTLTCGGNKTVWGIHDDGSLTGPGIVGTLAKRKS